jgi:hypothetical protein
MNKKLLIISLTIFLFSVPALRATETIGVLPFQNSQKALFPSAGETAADAVNMRLIKFKKYALIERSRLDAVLAEQSLGMTGTVNANQAAKVGEIAGCKYIVIGNITELRETKGLEKPTKETCVVVGCILGGFPGLLIAMIVPVRGYIVGMSTKVVDSKTAQIYYISSGTGNDSTMEDAMNKAAEKAMARFK